MDTSFGKIAAERRVENTDTLMSGERLTCKMVYVEVTQKSINDRIQQQGNPYAPSISQPSGLAFHNPADCRTVLYKLLVVEIVRENY
jgi:hypothetical protein